MWSNYDDEGKMMGLREYWREWFLYKRLDPACKSYVFGKMAEVFLETAKECGAIKGRFCADGGVMVFFKGVPRNA